MNSTDPVKVSAQSDENEDESAQRNYLIKDALRTLVLIFLHSALILLTVFCKSEAMVIGPIPPGTGVMCAAIGATEA